jgi:hypothetical protein
MPTEVNLRAATPGSTLQAMILFSMLMALAAIQGISLNFFWIQYILTHTPH